MGINIGLDIGAISLKLAALGNPGDKDALEALCQAQPQFCLADFDGRPLVLSEYHRIAGSPIQSTYDLLHEFYEAVPEERVEGIRVTGSGSRTIAKVLGLFYENEFKAIARMMGAFYPQVRTVFEIGGESSKYIRLEAGRDYRLRPVGRVRGGDRVLSGSTGAAHAVLGGGSGRGGDARPSAPRASPGAARCSPRAT